MLMPILTARTPAHPAHAAPAEAQQTRDQLQALALSVSGPRADAILKILETLGRHLNGSEVLPKEALARLMETLARILKFPPLPQETIPDFGRRLAAFLEKLPPEARATLEKQLGQRNLALQVRVLSEVLNSPAAATDTVRRQVALQNPSGATTGTLRAETTQPSRSALPLPALAAQHLATLTAGSAPANFGAPAEAALLQAALRRTFGAEEEQAALEAVADEADPDAAIAPKRTGEATQKAGQTQQTGDASAVRPAPRPAANIEAMPLLRAAAAFLAADPEALSLVSAIAQGEINPHVEPGFVSPPESGVPQPEEAGQASAPVTGGEPATTIETASTPEEDFGGADGTANRSDVGPQDDKTTLPRAKAFDNPVVAQTPTQQAVPFAATRAEGSAQAVRVADPNLNLTREAGLGGDGLASQDRGREESIQRQGDERPQPAAARQAEKPVRMLAETLKALVQTTLPVVDNNLWDLNVPSYQMQSEDAALHLASLQPIEEPGLEALLEAATVESDTGWTAELAGEIDSWATQADAGPDEMTEAHAGWMQPQKMDEAIRDPLLQHRLGEIAVAREAIPFAIIPYLPAKIEESSSTEPAQEQQTFANEDEPGEQPQGDEQPGEREEVEAKLLSELEADDDDSQQDAYAFYLRMGGLG